MAVAMRTPYLRIERLYQFLSHCNKSSTYLSQGSLIRRPIYTRKRNFHLKASPLLNRKWDTMRTIDHDFPRSRELSRQEIEKTTRSTNTIINHHEDESESDSDSDDQESRDHKFDKLKQRTARRASVAKSTLSQKSGLKKALRPSKYLFRDRGGWNEENQFEGRDIPEDVKSKTSWYARQLIRLTNEGKIDESLELFSRMKEEKVPLTVEIFNIIISAYAKNGKMRKAFKLYNDLKKRAMQATPHTYTSLFNVCTKSSSSQHALQNVEKLLSEINTRITRDDLEMNVITFNAAIQAVTVCGDPIRAFEIYKEMKHNNVKPDGHTFSSLLTACSFDKVEGPSIAIKLLDEMRSMKIKPDLYIYNSVLKVIRDFKVFNTAKNLHFYSNPMTNFTNSLAEEVSEKANKGDTIDINYDKLSQDTDSSLGDVNNARMERSEDLKLQNYFPGVEKFLQMMAVEEVYPDVRTFQLLLYLTSSNAEEEYLMELMKGCNISPDVTFYNTLVRKSALKGNLQTAKEHIKNLEETLNVAPSEKSYQVLARGCKGPEDGLALLNEIKSVGVTPAQSVYGTLIAGAAKQRQFTYLIQLVKGMTRDGIRPNDRIMTVLERVYNLPCKKPFIKENSHHRSAKEQRFRHVEQKGFRSFFENWREKTVNRVASSEDYDNDNDLTDDKDFSHL